MLRQITFPPSFSGWQRAARRALKAEWPPADIMWQELGADQPLLDLGDEPESSDGPKHSAGEARAISVPKSFVELARQVACHREPTRWSQLYALLWRLTHGEHQLMQIMVDSAVHQLRQMEKAIRHDLHKMRAFVRFRAVMQSEVTWYVAWFEPQHYIVELNAPFFVDRFAQMSWSILTPDRCAHWNQKELTITAGVSREVAPAEDQVETLWLQYYSHIFNPARVKTGAMQAEMPKIYWKNLPETAVIPALLREAPWRVESMMRKSGAKQPAPEDLQPITLPKTDDLEVLRAAALGCRACPLYRDATQTVFGEGPIKARVVLLGEQPGDQEDLTGRAFVGPAGQLLDRALADAGIDRRQTYVTNAVKHFKWEPSGKRRLHKKPSPREVAACRPWLAAEMGLVRPEVLVCLGSTAAQTVLGPEVRVLRDRGVFVASEFCPRTLVTVHPSSLLRAPDPATRERDYLQFVSDLRLVTANSAT